MSSPAPGDLATGQVCAAISNALVRITREHLGRGPTRARTTIRDDVVVIVMEDVMTHAERTLIAAGRREEVLRIRRLFQSTMREDSIAAVEELTGRGVQAFMSDNHVDPDLTCEVFVLAPAGNGAANREPAGNGAAGRAAAEEAAAGDASSETAGA